MLNPASPSGPAAASWSAIWRRGRGLVVMGRFLALLSGAVLVIALMKEGAFVVLLGKRTAAEVWLLMPDAPGLANNNSASNLANNSPAIPQVIESTRLTATRLACPNRVVCGQR